jgi:hypothetical protein
MQLENASGRHRFQKLICKPGTTAGRVAGNFLKNLKGAFLAPFLLCFIGVSGVELELSD